MRAAVLHGAGDLRVETVPFPMLEDGGVRVWVKAALTCGTDLKVYRRGYHARMLRPPCLFGHEFAGTISEVTPAACAAGWQVGERVVAANSAPCGSCARCLGGQANLCQDLCFLNGAYAASVAVPARIVEANLLRLRPGTGMADAALTEPLACVVLGLEELGMVPGGRLLVIGSGPVGLMAVALAGAAGMEVGMAGRGTTRLGVAERLGARWVGDVGEGGDVVGTAARMAGPAVEWDRVFEAVGCPATWEAALTLVRPGGAVNWFGGCAADARVRVDATRMHYGGLTVRASFHHRPATVRTALDWIEGGVIRAADLVTGSVGLEEVPALFEAMARGNRAVKTLVGVEGSA